MTVSEMLETVHENDLFGDELILAGKLQLKKLQKKKPEKKKKFRLRRGLNPCLPDTSWALYQHVQIWQIWANFFVAQLVERPTSIWEARVQAPSKPEFFFFRLLFLQFL